MVLKTKKKKATDVEVGGLSSSTLIENKINTTNLDDYLFNPKDYLDQEEILISIQGKNIGSVGNSVVITGKPKSRKSVVAHSIIGSAISNKSVLGIECNLTTPEDEIVLIDTEQSKHDLKKSLERMCNLVNIVDLPNILKVYSFRTLNPDKIKKAIQQILENKKIKLVIIDGGLDLINNMNDVIETKETIDFIKSILSENKICLVMIIHQSKASNFTIGHFGSFMDRFAQTNLEITKLDNGNSEIKAQLMRSDENFKPYEFYWNYNENNYSINWVEQLEVTAKYAHDYTDEQHNEKLTSIFSGQQIISYSFLVNRMMVSYAKSETWCKKLVKYLSDKNILTKSGDGMKHQILPF